MRSCCGAMVGQWVPLESKQSCSIEKTEDKMLSGTKELLVPLKRENKDIKDDPQFSPYFPSQKFCVFYEYGHPTELGCDTFRTKKEAYAAILEKPRYRRAV